MEEMLYNELKDNLNEKVYKYIGSVLYATKTSESWRGRRDMSIILYKEEKEALNAKIFCILLLENKDKITVNWDACIAYIVMRVIRKALTWDAKPENKSYLKANITDYEELVKKYIHDSMVDSVGKDFTEGLEKLASQISEEERELYLVAKNFANWVEFCHIQNTIYSDKYKRIRRMLKTEMKKVKVNKHINRKLKKLISQISLSRNIVRWQGCGPTLNCNILCHMFESAIFGYFMAMEENKVCGYEKFVPSDVFKICLYHDDPEIWTDDIPSPCKDISFKEHDGTMRPVTEQQEREALEEYYYPALPKKTREIFKQKIMLEEIKDEELHAFIKKVDYFSADYEVYWFIVSGSVNSRYYHLLLKTLADKDSRTPNTCKLVESFVASVKTKNFLEP